MLALTLSVMLAQSPLVSLGSAPRLKWDPRLDLPVVGVTLAGWLVTETALKPALAPRACRWCATNGFDTAVRSVFNPALTPSAYGYAAPDLASNVALVATPLAMLGLDALLSWRDGALHGYPVDVVIIAEATLIAMGLTQAAKFLVGRARPYTVGASAELLDVPGQADHDLSFFSGHTSFVTSAVAATGVVALLRGYRLGWLVWAVGVPLATATALLRLAADKHWASDVLMGAAVGVGVGLGVPLLFHGPEGRPAVQVAPLPGGLALTGRF